MKAIHSELTATVGTVATKNNLHSKCDASGTHVFVSYASDQDGREKLTAAALELSLMGYTVHAFPRCNFIEVTESPEDACNVLHRKAEETTAELVGRVFSQFSVTFSPEGYAYLTRRINQTYEDLSSAAEELSGAGFVVEYFAGSNFLQVRLTPETSEVVHTVYVLMHKTEEVQDTEDFDPESLQGTA